MTCFITYNTIYGDEIDCFSFINNGMTMEEIIALAEDNAPTANARLVELDMGNETHTFEI